MNKDRIVDGINLETGEIISAGEVVETERFVEALGDDGKINDRWVMYMHHLFPEYLWHFTYKKGGHMPMDAGFRNKIYANTIVTIKYDFKDAMLMISSPMVKYKKVIELATIVDIDSYCKKPISEYTSEEIKKYRITYSFITNVKKMSEDVGRELLKKLFALTKATQTNYSLYSKLRPAVLLGELSDERLVWSNNGFLETKKDGEKCMYVYQSILESRTVQEIIDLAKNRGR